MRLCLLMTCPRAEPQPAAVIRTRLSGTVNIPKGCGKEGALRLGAPSLREGDRTVHPRGRVSEAKYSALGH